MIDVQIRRHLFVAVAVSALTGCSNLPTLGLVGNSASDIFFPKDSDAQLTQASVAKIPYATIGVKVGRQPKALLVLSRFQQSNLHWLSADHVALVTNGGRLVKTAGFPADLKATFTYNSDPVLTGGLHKVVNGYRLMRAVDMQPEDRHSVRIDSIFRTDGRESIKIMGTTLDTVRVTERAAADAIDWKFENTYWVDPKSGFVWKSIQHFVPELPPAVIEVFRPASPPKV